MQRVHLGSLKLLLLYSWQFDKMAADGVLTPRAVVKLCAKSCVVAQPCTLFYLVHFSFSLPR
eukprot:SAG31_NODE_11791_length_998_cov_1.047831_1_plen_62_part_00